MGARRWKQHIHAPIFLPAGSPCAEMSMDVHSGLPANGANERESTQKELRIHSRLFAPLAGTSLSLRLSDFARYLCIQVIAERITRRPKKIISVSCRAMVVSGFCWLKSIHSFFVPFCVSCGHSVWGCRARVGKERSGSDCHEKHEKTQKTKARRI